MKRFPYRLLPILLIPAFALAGCAEHEAPSASAPAADNKAAPGQGARSEEEKTGDKDSPDDASEAAAQATAAASAAPEAPLSRAGRLEGGKKQVGNMRPRPIAPGDKKDARKGAEDSYRFAPKSPSPQPAPPAKLKQRASKPSMLPGRLAGGTVPRGALAERQDESKTSGELREADKEIDGRRTDERVRGQLQGLAKVPVVGTDAYHSMFFKHYGVNPTIDTEEESKSTFSVDVDTTSFSMARSFLSRGHLPAEASVRVEEFINSFDYGYRAPTDDVFNVSAEAAPSPNRSGYHLLHVGLKGKEIAKDKRKAANLVFVVDVSGSMDMGNRLGLVKQSLRLLVNQLKEGDTVGIVTYGSDAREVLAPASAYDKQRILRVIDNLRTEGATNAEAGIKMGYRMAARHLRAGKINRVVLCSDGVANSGLRTAGGILETVKREANRGITISTVGFGMGNYNDVMMEELAQGGNGNYHYVDRLDQARKVFVENLTGTLQVIAKDVKIQVEFDPSVVRRYRLLGYENRQLNKRDFNNDRVDAGEVGAGHSVTAVYEVKLVNNTPSKNLGKVRVRFKAPSGGASRLVERKLAPQVVRNDLATVTSPTHLSFIAAAFAEKMRGSYWARNVSYEDILGRFNMLRPELRARKDIIELKRLIERAEKLDSRQDKFVQHGPIAMMDFDRVPVLR